MGRVLLFCYEQSRVILDSNLMRLDPSSFFLSSSASFNPVCLFNIISLNVFEL